MRTKILTSMFMLAFFAGCKKTDNAAKWVGTYAGTAGNTFNQIVITEVDNNTLQMQLQTSNSGIFYTFVTIKSAKLSDATDVTINEDGYILPVTDTLYHFTGTGNLNGNMLTFSGMGVNKIYPSEVRGYQFTGSK